MLYPNMPTVRIAHAVPLTLLAGAGHWLFGSIDWLLLASLLSGSIPGIAIGSHFASVLPCARYAPFSPALVVRLLF